MSVGKDSLKRAASAATTKEEKTTATKASSKKAVAKKTEAKAENKTDNKEVTAAVNTGTSEQVKEMFTPQERVSHVREELPVYLL